MDFEHPLALLNIIVFDRYSGKIVKTYHKVPQRDGKRLGRDGGREQVWRRRWFMSNVHGSPFLFFDLRGDAMDKLAGIGKNVNDESCSTRTALLAYQLSFETVENPRSSMPNLLIFFDIF